MLCMLVFVMCVAPGAWSMAVLLGQPFDYYMTLCMQAESIIEGRKKGGLTPTNKSIQDTMIIRRDAPLISLTSQDVY